MKKLVDNLLLLLAIVGLFALFAPRKWRSLSLNFGGAPTVSSIGDKK